MPNRRPMSALDPGEVAVNDQGADAVGASFAQEVERLHRFFEDWFAGHTTSGFEDFDGAMAPTFHLVPPDGRIRERSELVSTVRAAVGSGAVTIEIRNPTVRYDDGSTVIGTYEEHQVRGDRASARQSTVMMLRDPGTPGGWGWLAVHETWIDPVEDRGVAG
jgi:hypothetical protein